MLSIVDQELSAKLESELQMERDMRDSDEFPESIKDYLDNGPFEVSYIIPSSDHVPNILQLLDTPGQEEVVLTRQFGDET